MKVLNLYAGIGGNRKLWEDVDVTAVEINPEIAAVYQDFFPDDKMVIGDAHQYLLEHFKEFDFIWSSRPCQSHSKARFWSNHSKNKPIYPDFGLYEEIVFLRHYYQGKWVAENVDPYYEELFNPIKIGRHLFWSNFKIGEFYYKELDINRGTRAEYERTLGISIKGYKISQRTDQILRNCVHPETGLYILNCARNIITKQNIEQLGIFE